MRGICSGCMFMRTVVSWAQIFLAADSVPRQRATGGYFRVKRTCLCQFAWCALKRPGRFLPFPARRLENRFLAFLGRNIKTKIAKNTCRSLSVSRSGFWPFPSPPQRARGTSGPISHRFFTVSRAVFYRFQLRVRNPVPAPPQRQLETVFKREN